jgi:hypothetical protein
MLLNGQESRQVAVDIGKEQDLHGWRTGRAKIERESVAGLINDNSTLEY